MHRIVPFVEDMLRSNVKQKHNHALAGDVSSLLLWHVADDMSVKFTELFRAAG